MTIAADIQKLDPGAIVELFELDLTPMGGSLLRFHSGVNFNSGDVVWQSNSYARFPIQAEGYEYNGRGQLPRPTLRVSNVGGLLTPYIALYRDLVGAKLTRKRTFVKYLDKRNYPGWVGHTLLTPGTSGNFGYIPHSNVLNPAVGSPFTFEFDFFAAATQPAGIDNSIMEKWNVVSGNNGYPFVFRLNSSTNAISWARYNGTTSIGGGLGSAIARDTWYRIGIASSGSAIRGFRDGVFISSVLETTGNVTNNAPLCFGARGTGGVGTEDGGNGNFHLNGGFDNIRYYSRQCSDAEMAEHAAGVFSNNANLDGHWTFDELSGQFLDQTASANHGTIKGTATRGNRVDSNPSSDPTAYFPDDVYYIDRKANENKQIIEFELASALDLAGVKLPRRQIIQNICPWKYRSAECGYAGGAVAKADDTPTAILGEDVCGKRLASCKLRFGATAPLPYGGFPAAGLLRT